MRVNVTSRTMRRVTVWHRADPDSDQWETTTYDATWQNASAGRSVSADGTATSADSVTVQIPGDQAPEVSKGDYVSLGTASFSGGGKAMRSELPSGARRVQAVADRTGGVGGASGVLRLASAWVVTAE